MSGTCRFCSSRDVVATNFGDGGAAMVCHSCGAQGPSFCDVADAEAAWGNIKSITALSQTEEQGCGAVAGPTFADAIQFIQQRLDNYVRGHGSYDQSTGVTEFPGNGDEYVYELEEIIEGLRALQNEGRP